MRNAILGVILWASGSVDITEPDLLWAARMLVGSQTAGAAQAGRTGRSDAAAARLWTAANRHVLQCDRDRRFGRPCRWRHFSDSFRAYSTAIAPQWRRGGPNCSGPFASAPICEERRLRRRERVSTLSWEAIAAQYGDLRGYLFAWARGLVEAPTGCSRAAHTDCRGCSPAPEGAVLIGSNWWACDRESCDWPDRYITIVPASGG